MKNDNISYLSSEEEFIKLHYGQYVECVDCPSCDPDPECGTCHGLGFFALSFNDRASLKYAQQKLEEDREAYYALLATLSV